MSVVKAATIWRIRRKFSNYGFRARYPLCVARTRFALNEKVDTHAYQLRNRLASR